MPDTGVTGVTVEAHRRTIVTRRAPLRCLTDGMGADRRPSRRAARAIVGALLVLLSATGCSPVGGGGGSGSCAAQEIVLADPHLTPGGQVSLSVEWMTERCEDTGGSNRAAEDVEVTITPESTGQERVLGVLDPASGPRFTVSGSVTLPDDIPPGDATLVVASRTGERLSASRDVTVTAD